MTRRGSEDYHLFVDASDGCASSSVMADDTSLRRILITSALPFEGKSTVVFNLGLALGEMGKRVIIADATSTANPASAHKNSAEGFDRSAGRHEQAYETITAITDNVQLASRVGALTAPARPAWYRTDSPRSLLTCLTSRLR